MSDIKKLIDERLWNFIKRSYISENYTAAILDSIHFIGDLIRGKSGLDSDGLNLIGNAFGGKNPKIKTNSLQTETDISIQKGIEQSLRGIYSAFRNPRSHTKYEDNEEDANAIILFINHLLKLIDKSKGAFSIESFLGRISDKSFVDNDLYVDLLIETIPKNKYFDITFELFKFKDHLPVKNLQSVFHNLLRELTDEQYEQIIEAASEDLRYTDNDDCITKTIALIGDFWDHISEDAKLRAENVLIKYLDNAKYVDIININHYGSYCLSLIDIYNNLSLKEEFLDTIYKKISLGDTNEQKFVIKYFGAKIEDTHNPPIRDLSDLIKKELSKENQMIYNYVNDFIQSDQIKLEVKELMNHFPVVF